MEMYKQPQRWLHQGRSWCSKQHKHVLLSLLASMPTNAESSILSPSTSDYCVFYLWLKLSVSRIIDFCTNICKSWDYPDIFYTGRRRTVRSNRPTESGSTPRSPTCNVILRWRIFTLIRRQLKLLCCLYLRRGKAVLARQRCGGDISLSVFE